MIGLILSIFNIAPETIGFTDHLVLYGDIMITLTSIGYIILHIRQHNNPIWGRK